MFAQAPLALLEDPRCHRHDVPVYLAIFSYCDFVSRTGSPTLAEITTRAHIGPESVTISIKYLQAIGWLKRTPIVGRATMYEALIEPTHTDAVPRPSRSGGRRNMKAKTPPVPRGETPPVPTPPLPPLRERLPHVDMISRQKVLKRKERKKR